MDNDSLDASGHTIRFVSSSQVMVAEQSYEAWPDVRVVEIVDSARNQNSTGQKDVFFQFHSLPMDARDTKAFIILHIWVKSENCRSACISDT